jgi:hypothetical protein
MRTSTPEPRLPLEPEEYPLYRPPSRIGCSALAIIPLILVLFFVFLFWRVTPQVAEGIVNIPRGILNISPSTPETTPGTGAVATLTAEPVTENAGSEPTPVPPTPTPKVEYVKVANTGGVGVKLRKDPKSGSASVVTVGEGAIFLVVGPDFPDPDTSVGVWRNVELPNDGRRGWVLAKYLVPSGAP